jgi:glycosyltransferase involved in cell wall biosynthesis
VTRHSTKRILFVTDLWLEQPYGIFTVISNMRRELEAKGWTVDVLDPSQFFTVPFPLYKGVRLAIFSVRTVRRRILDGNYDQIHVVTEGPLGWYTRRACRRLGIPFTTAFHAQLHLYAELWLSRFLVLLVRRLIVWFHSGATLTIVSTPTLREQLHSFGLQRIAVCPLGVDTAMFSHEECPAAFPRPVFLFMGRMSWEKNIDEFLSADLPGTKLVVGDGPDLKRLVRRFPQAYFAGYQKGKSLVAWCSCANVFVMPSRTETLGLAILECLALGIPVAAHNVTGPKDIIQNGVNGFLDENIAHAAKQCLTLSYEKCRSSVQDYTWSAAAEIFISILESNRNPH